jgi:hypothetical protein
LEGAELE